MNNLIIAIGLWIFGLCIGMIFVPFKFPEINMFLGSLIGSMVGLCGSLIWLVYCLGDEE